MHYGVLERMSLRTLLMMFISQFAGAACAGLVMVGIRSSGWFSEDMMILLGVCFVIGIFFIHPPRRDEFDIEDEEDEEEEWIQES